MRMPIEVEIIIFRKNKGKPEFLLLKRTDEKGGFWQPVTGRVEENERQIDTLKRELKEETGIADFIRIIKNVHYYEWENEKCRSKEYAFGVEVDPKTKVQLPLDEHKEYRWCSFTKTMKLLKWEGNKIALRKLNKMLNE